MPISTLPLKSIGSSRSRPALSLVKRSSPLTWGLKISKKMPHQQSFLVQVPHVLERLVPFLGGCFHLACSGGLLQALVFVQERIGWLGSRGQGFLAGPIKEVFRVDVDIGVGVVILQLVRQGVRIQRQV